MRLDPDHEKDAARLPVTHLEHQLVFDYFRAKGLIPDVENRFGCQTEAAGLVAAILKFRDTVNADERFVRYKVLVGFESVHPQQWTDEAFDYTGAEEYRRREADRYIEELNEANENECFDLILRCAATKSDDLATFPPFGNFISKLAERKPEIADLFLAKASDERPAIKAFAEKHLAELDVMIAAEQRLAETEREMRNRRFDEEEADTRDGSGDDGADAEPPAG